MDQLRQYWSKKDHAERLGEIHTECAYRAKTPMYHRSLFQRIAIIRKIVIVSGQIAFKDGDMLLFFSVSSPEHREIDIGWSDRLEKMVHLRYEDAHEILPR